MKKQYGFKKFEEVVKFVDKYYKWYRETHKLTISILIYALYNTVQTSKYYKKDIRDYKGIDFKITENEFYKYCDISLNDEEEYKIFFSDRCKAEYVEKLATDLADRNINEVIKKFPDIVKYIDKSEMINDYTLFEENLVGSVDGLYYIIRAGLFELYMYKIK
jgi:hypothetical protein